MPSQPQPCSASLGGAGAGTAERLAGCGPTGGQKQQRGGSWLDGFCLVEGAQTCGRS